MKKFNFPLEQVLEYRGFLEDALKRDLAKAQEELLDEKDLYARWGALQEDVQRELSIQKRMGMTVEDLRLYRSYLEMIDNSLKVQLMRVSEARRRVKEKRDELVEASKKKKILEHLKENQFRGYLKTADTWEQKFLDEVSLHQFVRENPPEKA